MRRRVALEAIPPEPSADEPNVTLLTIKMPGTVKLPSSTTKQTKLKCATYSLIVAFFQFSSMHFKRSQVHPSHDFVLHLSSFFLLMPVPCRWAKITAALPACGNHPARVRLCSRPGPRGTRHPSQLCAVLQLPAPRVL